MIAVRHFEESMKFARRSVSDMEIRKYEAIAQQQHSRIGLETDGRIGQGGSGGGNPMSNTMPAAPGGGGAEAGGDDDDDDLYS